MTDALSSESAIWLDLTGANQGWLSKCRAVLSKNPTALAEVSDNSPAARALQVAATRVVVAQGQSLDAPLVAFDWHVASRLRSLAFRIAGLRDPGPAAAGGRPVDAVLAMIRHADDAGLHSITQLKVEGQHSQWAHQKLKASPEVGHIFRQIRAHSSAAAPFVELLALELVNDFPATRDRVTLPVVLAGTVRGLARLAVQGSASNTDQSGTVGKLTLELLADGPDGLHPDPRLMCFLRADDDFLQAMQRAWSRAPSRLQGACVVWRLQLGTLAGRPIEDIAGGSLGAAFAIALHDLGRHGGVRRITRLRTLDPRCAVTAALAEDGHRLTTVTGLDRKVAAAKSTGLRLVVAQEDLQAAQRTPYSSHVSIAGVSDVRSADRACRTHANRNAQALLAAVLALILTVTITGLIIHRSNESHKAASAASARLILSHGMADRALELLATDPVFSARVALAAYQLQHTPQAIRAMDEALTFNPYHAKTIKTPKTVGSLGFGDSGENTVLTSNAAWLNTLEGIVGYSLKTMKVLGPPVPVTALKGRANATNGLSASPDGKALAAVGSLDVTVFTVGLDGGLHRTAYARLAKVSDFLFVKWAPTGRTLFIADTARGKYWLWTPGSGRPRPLQRDLSVLYRYNEYTCDGPPLISTRAARQRWSFLVIAGHRPSATWSPGKSDKLKHIPGLGRQHIYSISLPAGRVRLLARSQGPIHCGKYLTGPHGSLFELAGRRLFRLDPIDGRFLEVRGELARDRWARLLHINNLIFSDGEHLGLARMRDGTTTDLFRGPSGSTFKYYAEVGPNRIAAYNPTAKLLIRVDLPKGRPDMLHKMPVAVSPDGEELATAFRTPRLDIQVKPRAQEAKRFSKDLPSYTANFGQSAPVRSWVTDGVALSERYVASAASPTADTDLNAFYIRAMAWDRTTRAQLVNDTCRDSNELTTPTASLTSDNDEFVVTNGPRICRWRLPSGRRFPDIVMPNEPGVKNVATPAVDSLKLGAKYILATVLSGSDSDVTYRAVVVSRRDGHRTTLAGSYVDAAIAPNGQLAALVSNDGTINVVSLPTGRILRTFVGPRAPAAIAWSPDGQRLALLDDHEAIRSIDATTGLESSPPLFSVQRDVYLPFAPRFDWPAPGVLFLESDPSQVIDISKKRSWESVICRSSLPMSPELWFARLGRRFQQRDPC